MEWDKIFNARRYRHQKNNVYIVKVNAPAAEGRANERLIELLSEHFKRPKRNISIIKGFKSKNKLIEIIV